jgi:hypothetical protein
MLVGYNYARKRGLTQKDFMDYIFQVNSLRISSLQYLNLNCNRRGILRWIVTVLSASCISTRYNACGWLDRRVSGDQPSENLGNRACDQFLAHGFGIGAGTLSLVGT